MTSHDEFFQQRQPAAVLKHAVLREYSRVFASAVGSQDRSRPVWVIDGYAGAGAYEEPDPEGRHPDGSPLVVLRMAQRFAKTQVINGIFIEADPGVVTSLERNVQPFREGGLDVTVLQGTVEDRLADAWKQVAHDPVVTFLDPFGVAIGRQTMTLLLSRERHLRPSEVLLNINLEAVWRIGGNLEAQDGQVVPRAGQERGVEAVDAFLGGVWWRETFLETRQQQGSAARAAEHVVTEYRAQIRKATGYESMSIPIRRRPNHEPLFLLTLFYRHPLGGYKFADAACRATKRWRHAYRQKELAESLAKQPQESLFGDDKDIAWSEVDGKRQEAALDSEWVQIICDNLRSLGGAQLHIASSVVPILGQTLGLAGERHIRLAWDRLADEGYLHSRDKAKKMHHGVILRTYPTA